MENLLLGLVTPLSGLSFLSSLFSPAIPAGQYTHATFLNDDDESDDESDDSENGDDDPEDAEDDGESDDEDSDDDDSDNDDS